MSSLNLTVVAFAIGMLAAAGIYALLLVTLLTNVQLWPPGDKSWAYYLHWSLVGIFNLALVSVTLFDWNTWVLSYLPTRALGLVLTLLGVVVFTRGTKAMQSEETMGVTGELHTDGPYALSRNPQYVGMIVGLVGFAILVNSRYLTLLALTHIGWVLLLPLAEEPHLRDEYGKDYEAYLDRTPRFIDVRTIRRIISRE